MPVVRRRPTVADVDPKTPGAAVGVRRIIERIGGPDFAPKLRCDDVSPVHWREDESAVVRRDVTSRAVSI